MKISNLYNLDSFKALQASAGAKGFKDSIGGVILARNLTAIDPRILEKRYPELTFVNSGITVDNIGGYASEVQSLRTISAGGFANAGDSAGNKGLITLSAEDNTIPIVDREAHSIWSDTQIQRAQLQGINLVSRYITTHRQIYLQEIDEIGYLGIKKSDGTYKTAGLLNNSTFALETASKAVEDMTAQEAYDEVSDFIISQRNDVNNTPQYTGSRLVMRTAALNRLQSLLMTIDGNRVTVLKNLQQNFPEVQFLSTFRADNVPGLNTSVACIYSNSDEAMTFRAPIPLTVGQIIRQSSFDYRMDSKYSVAGLDILESTSGKLLKGF